MASRAARDDLATQVDDAIAKGAIAKGAIVHLGGDVPSGPAAFYPATVLTDVTPQMRAYQEELFGPVAVLHRFSPDSAESGAPASAANSAASASTSSRTRN